MVIAVRSKALVSGAGDSGLHVMATALMHQTSTSAGHPSWRWRSRVRVL